MNEKMKKLVLVVDDDPINLMMAKHAIEMNYRVDTAQSGEEALEYLEQNVPDMILIDIEMPGMNGKETVECIKDIKRLSHIPIVFITADSDPTTEVECLQLGADDFIIKPFVSEVMNMRIGRIFELYDLRYDLERQLEKKQKQLELVTLNAITSIAHTVDAKDIYTSKHSSRVAVCAVEIARKMGFDEYELKNLHSVALLHDIGKIGVRDEILNKAGRLTDDEYEEIKKHPVIGGEILKDITIIEHVREGTLFHHERYDGKGYPYGLAGENIPLYARIICVADAYDAMASDRVYRKGLTNDRIIQEIEKNKGQQFDPHIADIFLSMLKEGFDLNKLMEMVQEQEENESESSSLLSRVISEYTETARKMSQTDVLTGLYNRTYIENKVTDMLGKRRYGTLCIIDMDNFKHMNDTYGHIIGDNILKKFAENLRSMAAQEDIVCRLGGDEFLIYFSDENERDVIEKRVQEIHTTINQKFESEEEMYGVSLSMGVAVSPEDGDSFQTLYANADKALYFVKNNGKNSYHFYSDGITKKTEVKRSVDLENIRRMIEGNIDMSDGSMKVAYKDFHNLYSFISRCVKRKKQEVQTVLFTITEGEADYVSNYKLMGVMDIFERAVTLSLRASDVGTKYSSSQYIVILLDSDYENGERVAERVVSKFSELYKEREIVLKYELETMVPCLYEECDRRK